MSCTVRYSFTGASLTDNMKSISVQYFQNRADIVNPTLSQEFTEALKDKFISQTSLDMMADGGDLNFEGEIVGYSTEPAAITGNETAALNRFTIRIKVKFTNLIDPAKDFESTFSHYADYDSQNSLDAVEGELVPEILEKIIEDIFNKAVVNW
ncbi:MAG: LptE family protein [Bacteroidales bacterium]|nr:LptE family protein [Bacteroidales bacterium]